MEIKNVRTQNKLKQACIKNAEKVAKQFIKNKKGKIENLEMWRRMRESVDEFFEENEEELFEAIRRGEIGMTDAIPSTWEMTDDEQEKMVKRLLQYADHVRRVHNEMMKIRYSVNKQETKEWIDMYHAGTDENLARAILEIMTKECKKYGLTKYLHKKITEDPERFGL